MPARLTHETVAERIRPYGFELVEPYRSNSNPTLLRCSTHGETHRARLSDIMDGRRGLRCCKAAKLRAANLGKPQGAHAKAVAVANFQAYAQRHGPPRLGRKASAETIEKLRRSHLGYEPLLEAVMKIAAKGKTGGKPGVFYVTRNQVDGTLKFGSTLNLRSRLYSLRWKEGDGHELVLVAQVADAGGYEAAMMERHRRYWIAGERFQDFLRPS